MKSLIVGMGEVGKALFNVLHDAHECSTYDVTEGPAENLPSVQALNICFPYGPEFVASVYEYARLCNPTFIIIHSTVPVGTTRAIGNMIGDGCHVVHSPIHGRHPDLSEGIRTFLKYVGGLTDYGVGATLNYFAAAGIKCRPVANPETSELSKIACTSQTAVGILVMQEIHRLCEETGANFDEVYGWNAYYNMGYAKLNQAHFSRPQYKYVEGRLGGHCLTTNASLFEGWMADLIRERG